MNNVFHMPVKSPAAPNAVEVKINDKGYWVEHYSCESNMEIYIVTNRLTNTTYNVELFICPHFLGSRCTCPHYKYRCSDDNTTFCKHVLAVIEVHQQKENK